MVVVLVLRKGTRVGLHSNTVDIAEVSSYKSDSGTMGIAIASQISRHADFRTSSSKKDKPVYTKLLEQKLQIIKFLIDHFRKLILSNQRSKILFRSYFEQSK